MSRIRERTMEYRPNKSHVVTLSTQLIKKHWSIGHDVSPTFSSTTNQQFFKLSFNFWNKEKNKRVERMIWQRIWLWGTQTKTMNYNSPHNWLLSLSVSLSQMSLREDNGRGWKMKRRIMLCIFHGLPLCLLCFLSITTEGFHQQNQVKAFSKIQTCSSFFYKQHQSLLQYSGLWGALLFPISILTCNVPYIYTMPLKEDTLTEEFMGVSSFLVCTIIIYPNLHQLDE